MDSEKLLKVTKGAEKFWLFATILTSCWAIWEIRSSSFDDNKFKLLIPILAGVWYTIRRIFRKRLERDIGK
tara:strand:+ start:98 stop:310 length:213 start_codon:yes stop_codon:yes gene_type:complete